LSRIPDKNEPLTISGFLNNPSRLFLNVLQRIIDRDIEISYRFERYDSLILLNEQYPNPNPNMTAVVSGQGLAIYKDGVGWVLAADDVTLIV